MADSLKKYPKYGRFIGKYPGKLPEILAHPIFSYQARYGNS